MPRLFRIWLVLTVGFLLASCGHHYPPPPNLPDPIVNLQVGPGDVLEVLVVGEEKLPHEYEIQPDGSLDFPYTKGIKVAGLEPRDIAAAIRQQLVEAKFLVSPQVQVKVKAFNSKKVQVIGQVTKPGPMPYQDGMTLVQAISAAGWFTPLADTNHVQLIRVVSNSKSVNAIVSVDAITDNNRADVKLQQGDTIKVDQRLF
ncbi:MAG TPA: polysaccharide biosynthesis/export family protein [Labilithrix sp.]|nr:polysaccharide biosynthesis/export family protein [Labilithrix sp.]